MCGWEGNGFPGSQPVSMDQKNINFLHREPYHVSWKADGTRYMFLKVVIHRGENTTALQFQIYDASLKRT